MRDERPDRPPSSQEICRLFVIEGAEPFEMRGWRGDYIKGALATGDWYEEWRILRVSKENEAARYFRVFFSTKEGFKVSVQPVDSYRENTEAQRAINADAKPERIEQKHPKWNMFDLARKGARIIPDDPHFQMGSYGGAGFGKDRVAAEIHVNLEVEGDRWGYMLGQTEKDQCLILRPMDSVRWTYPLAPKKENQE